MKKFNDVYSKVGMVLGANNFYGIDNEGKKTIIDVALKNYLSEKIEEYDSTKCLPEDIKENVSVNDLVETLGEIIPQEEHMETIAHLTHYVLALASGLQRWSIIWEIDDSEEFLDNPLITFTENGNWDKLTTHEQTSYVKSFELAHKALNNMLSSNKKTKEQVTFVKRPILKSDN